MAMLICIAIVCNIETGKSRWDIMISVGLLHALVYWFRSNLFSDCGIADSSQLPPLDATVAHLQEELAQKDVEIARLRMEKESERAHHQQEIEQIRATAKRELAQKDVEIARLCKKLLQRERACSAAKRETVASQVKSLDKVGISLVCFKKLAYVPIVQPFTRPWQNTLKKAIMLCSYAESFM